MRTKNARMQSPPGTQQHAPLLEYRMYKMDGDRIVGLAGALACETDQAAVEKAAQLCDGRDLEVWNAARFVARIAASAYKQLALPVPAGSWTQRLDTSKFVSNRPDTSGSLAFDTLRRIVAGLRQRRDLVG